MRAVESVVPGLSRSEVEKRRGCYGLNEFEKPRKFSVVRLLVAQLASPLIYILLIAMGVTLLLGDVVDTVVIGLAVVVNTGLGFWQEYKAERNLEQLALMVSPKAVVVRGGQRLEVKARSLVPGDVVFLEAGERVPADGVVVGADNLRVNEAILTGEAMLVGKRALAKNEVEKLAGKMKDERWAEASFVPVQGRKRAENESVYMGTTVMTGSATMVVAATGKRTQIGKIAGQLAGTKEEKTPLQKKLGQLSNRLALMILILAGGIFGVGMLAGDSFVEMFTLSVAVAVSAIPEGLVVSLTAILAIGMQRILKRKALVRKLVAAEVLGSVSVICSDKTGTLTQGSMKVVKAELVDEKLGLAAALVSADLKDPMEVALREWAEGKLGEVGTEQVIKECKRLGRMPFSSEKKYSATLCGKEMFVVGAPEVLVRRARMSRREQVKWEEKIKGYARQGYRVIGLAHRASMGEARLTKRLLEKPWYFLGLVLYADPLRKGLKKQLARTKQAGISLKVITGDYRETALWIMKELGMRPADEAVMDGEELEQIADSELDQRIKEVQLFARTSPEQKLKIVESLQRQGEVVAMTGDGVNDAPALKKADIGIVVSTASDVSKETADMVLMNDDFSTIVAAIEEGRGIFANLRKVLLYLLSDAFAEVILVVGALILRLPLPITAAQILWINLVDDGLPNLALTVDPKDKGLLRQKPRDRNEPIVNKQIKVLIGLISMASALAALGVFQWYLAREGLEYARTMSFTTLAVSTLLYVFSSRAIEVPVWKEVPWRNPWLVAAVVVGGLIQLAALYWPPLQRLLATVPLNWTDWGVVLTMSLGVVMLIEIVKGRFHRSGGEAVWR